MESETPNMKNAQDRFIETIKFLEARAQEVNFFQNYVKNKGSNPKKLVIQKLPKHMRRRAMSHNRYRVPSRVRKIAKDGFSKSVNTPRKFIPRKTARKFLFKSRSDIHTVWNYNIGREEKILEHHQYLAKRMRMKVYEGVKIASRANAKCFKTAYKFSYTNCTVVDKSYYRFVEIHDKEDKIKSITEWLESFGTYCINVDQKPAFLRVLVDPMLVADIESILTTRFGIKIIRKLDYKEVDGLVGPNESSNALIYNNLFNCFEMLGSQILSTLKRFFNKYSADLNTEFFTKDFSLISFPKSYREAVNLEYNRDKIASAPFVKADLDNDTMFDERINKFYDFLMSYKRSQSYLDKVVDNAISVIKSVQRLEASRTNNGNYEPDANKMNLETKLDENPKKPLAFCIKDIYETEQLPLVIINGSIGKLPRLIIVSPPSTGNFMLSNVQKSGALLIGKKEHEFVLQQYDQRLFPQDFPTTNAFRSYWMSKAEEGETKFVERNIRFNYIQNNFAFPFYGFIHKNLQIIDVSCSKRLYNFVTLTKGSIKKNALVFEPSESDLLSLASLLTDDNDFFAKILNRHDMVNFDLREPDINVEGNEYENLVEYKSKLETICNPLRHVLGQVLHSHFNYQIYRPKGVLYADIEQLNTIRNSQISALSRLNSKLLRNGELILLARNAESFKYFFIKAKLL